MKVWAKEYQMKGKGSSGYKRVKEQQWHFLSFQIIPCFVLQKQLSAVRDMTSLAMSTNYLEHSYEQSQSMS